MISVIIPIYNAEPYVGFCMDSILRQTYTDLEILLVDDDSTDNSAEICNNYCTRDNRCRLIVHQKNKGAAVARNTGICAATGDYIAFIDADDWIHPRYFEYLFRAIKELGGGLSMVSSCVGMREHNVPVVNRDVIYSTRIMLQEELINGLFCFSIRDPKLANVIYNVVWGKLYRRDLLDGIFFKDQIDHDTEFNYRVYQKLDQAIVVQEELHYYLIRSSSLSYNPQPSKINTVFDGTILALNVIPASKQKDRGDKLLQLYKRILSIRYRVFREEQYYPYLPTFYPKIKQVAATYWKEFFFNRHIGIHTKIIIGIFYYFPFSYNVFKMFMEIKYAHRIVK